MKFHFPRIPCGALGCAVVAGVVLAASAPSARADVITGEALAQRKPIVSAPDFQTPARAAILYDLTSDTVLYSKNALRPFPPASISKLATLYAVFRSLKNEELTLDDKFTVSRKAWRTGGSKMFVEVGKQVRIEDLIRGIVVSSGNDASVVIAEGFSGTEDAFADELNRIGREELRLTASNFRNATGLPALNHQMSATDIATLAARIIADFPEYYHYFAEDEFTWSNIQQYNRNRVLYIDGLGADGLKTGFTQASGYGLAASAKKGDRRLVLAITGLSSTAQRTSEAERILRWGWNSFTHRKLLSGNRVLEHAPVWLGVDSHVPLALEDDLRLTLHKSELEGIKLKLAYEGPISAPIKKGDRIGELIIELPKREQSLRLPVVATEGVAPLAGMARVGAALRYLVLGAEAVVPGDAPPVTAVIP